MSSKTLCVRVEILLNLIEKEAETLASLVNIFHLQSWLSAGIHLVVEDFYESQKLSDFVSCLILKVFGAFSNMI